MLFAVSGFQVSAAAISDSTQPHQPTMVAVNIVQGLEIYGECILTKLSLNRASQRSSNVVAFKLRVKDPRKGSARLVRDRRRSSRSRQTFTGLD